MPVLLPLPVRIRLLEPSDADRVSAGIAKLSPTSLQLRFGRRSPPTGHELAWLTRLDGRTCVAFGACHSADDSPVGLARYVAGSPCEAEIAVTVVDDWQGRGIGAMLLTRLVEHAAATGIETLTASVALRNVPALRLMRRIGATAVAHPELGVVELRARVAPLPRATGQSTGQEGVP